MAQRQTYLVWVRLINGRTEVYQLPKDVATAVNQYRKENKNQPWAFFFKGGLVNVPLGPYINYRNFSMQPPIVTGRIEKIKAYRWLKKHHQIPRTRSQFIQATDWYYYSQRQLFSFLSHDFSRMNQKEILRDIKFWQGHTYPKSFLWSTQSRIWWQKGLFKIIKIFKNILPD